MSGVLNDVDFEMLSQIIEATNGKQQKTQQTESGTNITPGMMGVDPGNAPVMSLFDFAKKGG